MNVFMCVNRFMYVEASVCGWVHVCEAMGQTEGLLFRPYLPFFIFSLCSIIISSSVLRQELLMAWSLPSRLG